MNGKMKTLVALAKKLGVEVLGFDLEEGIAQVKSASGVVIALVWRIVKETGTWQVA